MKLLTLLTASLSLLAFSCILNEGSPAPEHSTVVKHGTSFGFCIGYCKSEMTIRGVNVTFQRSSWQEDTLHPVRETTAVLRMDEWDAIVRSIDFVQLSKLDTIIGCPDCADGGAEWIEVTDAGYHKKVTFEFGKSLPYIQQLVDRLRAAEERFRSFSRNP